MSVEVVICSADDQKYANVVRSLFNCRALPIERVIRVHDAQSMCEGYNRGASQTVAPWLLFCHDDIEIIRSDEDALADVWANWDVVGVCGTARLTAPNWYDSDPNHLLGSVLMPLGKGCRIEHQIFGSINQGIIPAQALDGIFIACRRTAWAALKFDDALAGFTGYDVDFSYRAYLWGFRVGVITNLFVYHESHVANFSPQKMAQWQKNQTILRRKFNFRGQSDGYVKHACVQYETKDAFR